MAYIKVASDQFSLAIGKRGENIRLASALTGWKINVQEDEQGMSEESSPEEYEEGASQQEESTPESGEENSSADKNEDEEKQENKDEAGSADIPEEEPENRAETAEGETVGEDAKSKKKNP